MLKYSLDISQNDDNIYFFNLAEDPAESNNTGDVNTAAGIKRPSPDGMSNHVFPMFYIYSKLTR